MTKARLHRRTLLRSSAIAGVALALPPLEAMLSSDTARAQTEAARKVLLFQHANGVFLPDWIPSGSGASWTPSPLLERQPDDPAAITSDVASVRAHVNVVSGLTNEQFAYDAHLGPNSSFLTGTADRESLEPTGPSIDTVLASSIGGDTPFPVLRIGMNDDTYDLYKSPHCDEAGLPLWPVTSPRTLYGMLTGLVAPGGSPSDTLPRDFQRSVLDYVRQDIESVRSVCGVGDRRILDEHFDSIRDLERRIDIVDTVSCELPDLSAQLAELPDRDARTIGNWPNTPNSENLPLRVDVLTRIAVLSLRCDLTNVVALSLGASSSRQTYPFLGLGNTDDHYFSHLQRDPGNRTMQLQWNVLTRWKMAQLASLIEQLAMPDATGSSLLDETVVVAASELGNGAAHLATSLPVIVAGNVGSMASASGRGQHVVVPADPDATLHRLGTPVPVLFRDRATGPSGHTPMANLWLTVLRAVGVERASFGDSTGTIPGLFL